ncbi:hypothetical protein [Thermoanaerobacterium thermosulfurigenes]|uniref:hypothetical protein n=1 Tax=Thermoanaerobacterium thermosulfurigenes TaxID=33950 RepID=UPI003EF8C579
MSNNKSNNLLYKFIVFWLFFYVLFAERFVLKIKTGGKGIVSVPALITVLLFLYIFIKSKGSALKLFRSKFFSYWCPFVILTILLPIMGVLLMSYPLRTIFNLNLISGISFLIIGYWVSKRITAWEFIFRKYLFVAIVIEFLYSLFQFLYQKGFIPRIFWFRFYMWDVTSQQLYASPIFGRSIGTFVNPNTLGFWALIVFGFSLYLVNGHLKLILIALSFLTLILSQSRGSFFGLIFFFIVSLSINLIRPKKFSF